MDSISVAPNVSIHNLNISEIISFALSICHTNSFKCVLEYIRDKFGSDDIMKVLNLFQHYGDWSSYLITSSVFKGDVLDECVKIFANQLKLDMRSCEQNESISSCVLHAPREGMHYDRLLKLPQKIAREMFPYSKHCMKEYRLTIASLSEYKKNETDTSIVNTLLQLSGTPQEIYWGKLRSRWSTEGFVNTSIPIIDSSNLYSIVHGIMISETNSFLKNIVMLTDYSLLYLYGEIGDKILQLQKYIITPSIISLRKANQVILKKFEKSVNLSVLCHSKDTVSNAIGDIIFTHNIVTTLSFNAFFGNAGHISYDNYIFDPVYQTLGGINIERFEESMEEQI